MGLAISRCRNIRGAFVARGCLPPLLGKTCRVADDTGIFTAFVRTGQFVAQCF